MWKIAVCCVEDFDTLWKRLKHTAGRIEACCTNHRSTLNKKRCPSDLVQACLPRGYLGTLLRKPKRVRTNPSGGFPSLAYACHGHQARDFVTHRITRTRGGIGVRQSQANYLSRRRTAIYTLLYIRARGEASYNRTLRTSEPPCMRKTATTTPCAWGKGREVLPD